MRVLFLTHRLPYAPNRGDRIRARAILQVLSRKCELDLVSFAHDSEEAGQAASLDDLASSVTVVRPPRLRNFVRGVLGLATRRTLTHTLLDAPRMRPVLERIVARRPPDVVLAYCSGMARFAMEPPLDGVPMVLDMVDVDSEKWASLAATSGPAMRWIYRREARHLARFEAAASRRAVTTLVVNERERDAMRRMVPEAEVLVVPNGVDLEGFRPPGPPSGRSQVIFCGVMDYSANVEAAVRLANEIWPPVKEGMPEARLLLVGADPVASVRALHDPQAGVIVTGSVPDVRPHHWESAVSVAPLAVARGIQNKVLQALGAGLPCVVTPEVAGGLPAAALRGCVEADSPGALSRALLDLLRRSPAERRAMAECADLGALAWSERLAPLIGVLNRACHAPQAP